MRFLIAFSALIYVIFSVSCFRLLRVDPGWGLAVGERLFTLLGGLALGALASPIAPVIATLAGAVELRRAPA